MSPWVICILRFSCCSFSTDSRTRDSPPSWELGKGLRFLTVKEPPCYDMLQRASELVWGTSGLLLWTR